MSKAAVHEVHELISLSYTIDLSLRCYLLLLSPLYRLITGSSKLSMQALTSYNESIIPGEFYHRIYGWYCFGPFWTTNIHAYEVCHLATEADNKLIHCEERLVTKQ